MDLGAQFRLAKWSLRKLQLGIRSGDLVLDVGSGGNPHPRADVLLEKHLHGQHRRGELAVADRPTVFADACKMPFKDKAFDFAIAFHVLEHSRDPAAFLQELSRVAKAGYIETPNVIFERLVPYDVHLLEIMDLEGRLYIQKKWSPATDTFGHQLQVYRRDPAWNRFFYSNPALFHVRYSWRDKILFEIVNPAEDCAWFLDDESADSSVANEPSTKHWRARGLKLLRRWYKLRPRTGFSLSDILVCPECRKALRQEDGSLVCDLCQVLYPSQPWPNFSRPAPAHPRPAPVSSGSTFDGLQE